MKYLFLLLFPLSALATESPRTISVTGLCQKTVTTDQGSVVLTIKEVKADLTKSASEANKKSNDLKAKLNDLKIKDLEVKQLSYQMNELKEWEKEKMVSKGFQTLISYKTTTKEISQLGKIIALAEGLGIKEISSLELSLSDKSRNQLLLECLKSAGEDAKVKAQQIALGLGVTVDKVLQVSYDRSYSPPPSFYNRSVMAMKSADMVAPEIAPQNEDFILNLNVTFSIN